MHYQFLNKWLKVNHICPLCDLEPADNSGACLRCQSDLPFLFQSCSRCALPGIDGLCSSCQASTPSYQKVFAGFNYSFPLPQLIHRIKTGRDPEPLYWLSSLLVQLIGDNLDPNSVLMPVPMHPWDQMLRGFNQSALISQRLAKVLQMEHRPDMLVKQQRTPHQASLNRTQRKENLRQCYALSGEIPERVTLVDDVMTTGTTAERLSDLLLQAGCKKVDIAVLCRTPG